MPCLKKLELIAICAVIFIKKSQVISRERSGIFAKCPAMQNFALSDYREKNNTPIRMAVSQKKRKS